MNELRLFYRSIFCAVTQGKKERSVCQKECVQTDTPPGADDAGGCFTMRSAIEQPEGGGQLNEENGGQSQPEIPVLGLMVKKEHPHDGPHAAAQQGREEKVFFRDAPGVPFCPGLIHTHEDEPAYIRRQQPYRCRAQEQLLHLAPPPFDESSVQYTSSRKF